jgi:hypothetical protein
MAVKKKLSPFGIDGMRAFRKFFAYSVSAYAIMLVLVLASIALSIGSYSYPSATSSIFALMGGGAALSVALAVIIAVLIGLSVYAVISLMLGIRDVRRSGLAGFKLYASVSKWLKASTVTYALLFVAFGYTSILSAINAIQGAYLGGSVQNGMLSAIEFVLWIALLAIDVVFAFEMSRVFKGMSKDLAQTRLSISGNTLLLGISVLVASSLISTVYGFLLPPSALQAYAASIPQPVSLALLIVDAIGIAVLVASSWFGYRGASASLGV